MNKLVLLGLAVISFILFACEKDYVCECVYVETVPAFYYNGQYFPEEVTTEVTTESITATKSEAKTECYFQGKNTFLSPYSHYGQGPTVRTWNCDIK